MDTERDPSGRDGGTLSDQEPKPPFPEQKLGKPGIESELRPRPRYQARMYKPARKLEGEVALVTGGTPGSAARSR